MLYIISIIITVYWNFGWFLLPHWLRAYQFIFIPEILQMFKPFSNAVGFLDFHPWNRELENVHRKLRSRPSTFLGSQVQHFKNFWNNPKLPKPVNWLRGTTSQTSSTLSHPPPPRWVVSARLEVAPCHGLPKDLGRPNASQAPADSLPRPQNSSNTQGIRGCQTGWNGGGYEVYFPCSPKLSWWNWRVRMSFEDVVIHAWIGRRVDRHILKVKTWNLHKVTKVWGNKNLYNKSYCIAYDFEFIC